MKYLIKILGITSQNRNRNKYVREQQVQLKIDQNELIWFEYLSRIKEAQLQEFGKQKDKRREHGNDSWED